MGVLSLHVERKGRGNLLYGVIKSYSVSLIYGSD